jgi:hypothetical protein
MASVAILALVAACSDTTTPDAKGSTANRRVIAPGGTLDQNINDLLDRFPKGLANAGKNRWGNVKAKYQAGLNNPQQMKVAKKMLFELSQWVTSNAASMTPTTDESATGAAARLTLYMAMYVYGSPAETPPVFVAGSDNAVGTVTPTEAATIVDRWQITIVSASRTTSRSIPPTTRREAPFATRMARASRSCR